MNKTYGWALVAFILIFAIGSIVAYRHNRKQESLAESAYANLAEYTSTVYGYRFAYSAADTVRTTSEEEVSIGRPANQTFMTFAQVRVATTSEESYESFVTTTLQSLCTKAGKSCNQPAQSQSYTAAAGLNGMVHTFAAEDGSSFGPLYVFDITKNVPNTAHAIVVLYPPTSETAAQVTELARTLRITTP